MDSERAIAPADVQTEVLPFRSVPFCPKCQRPEPSFHRTLGNWRETYMSYGVEFPDRPLCLRTICPCGWSWLEGPANGESQGDG